MLRNLLLYLLPAQRAVGPQVDVRDAGLQVVREVLQSENIQHIFGIAVGLHVQHPTPGRMGNTCGHA